MPIDMNICRVSSMHYQLLFFKKFTGFEETGALTLVPYNGRYFNQGAKVKNHAVLFWILSGSNFSAQKNCGVDGNF